MGHPAVALPSATYTRHRPETTALYEVVRDNLETLYGAIDDGALDVRVPKNDSAWGGGLCATAANLIERVLPDVALRQWVLTFPHAWRRRLAQDGALLSALTRIFVESVHTFYAERSGASVAKSGAVTVVQRTSSDLRLNPHLHTLFLDGVYHEQGASLVWEPLGHLQTREVGEVLAHAVRRIARHLRRHGAAAVDEHDEHDPKLRVPPHRDRRFRRIVIADSAIVIARSI